MKLLLAGALADNSYFVDRLEEQGWDITLHKQESELVEHPENYDCVVCNGLFLHNPIERFSNLKVIHLTSAGLDRVPLDYIKDKDIKLYNARGVYSIPMAEWALSVILNEYRQIPVFWDYQKSHRWEKIRNLRELSGREIAIIGAGNVGSEVAKRLKAFGAKIKGFDIITFENPEFESIENINKFDSALFDIIILTATHTPQTHHLMNAEKLLRMKSSALLVNMSRGALVDEEALCRILSDREDLIAILDVFEQEPLSVDSPLWSLPNIRIYPHNSFVGENNNERLTSLILSNLSALAAEDGSVAKKSS